MNTIMIVDDDAGIRDILKIIFERAGYEVWLDGNGKFIFKDQFPLPDIFLLDRYLPGMDGLEICRHLKNNKYSKHVPVIIMSASPDLSQSAANACANGFVEKPFDINHLIGLIDTHIEQSKS